uniref:Daunorubicin resistance protein DrrA family ABC transporter ATP-binding protein n=1 Tax=Thermosporothrix sp. COM3 TaxID=2490863 RepID=A0A455SHY0_9CHLR|nr:daunorubicin resistance protein DrrA family ABC transporter ATP-binding protein [Thermosporothrix sp. COM3]
MHTKGFAILAKGLYKRYGKQQALQGFNLAVPEGTVCGLLGPNGAGKTTAVRILTTLLHADEGTAEVAGFDVRRQAEQVRSRIGLLGQYAALDEILSGRQNLRMFARLYHLGAAEARRRTDELLERFDLIGAADKSVRHYSGGMRRRLDLAASLIIAPQVLFLDEPTTGLDPRSRNEVWTAIRSLVADGTSVLLTTQYLEEADQLADSIAVIEGGRIIAEGTPDQLKARLGGDRIQVVLHRAEELPAAESIIRRVTAAEVTVDEDRRQLSALVQQRVVALTEVARALADAEIEAEDIALRRPTLDEVFLHLTEKHEEVML